MSAAAKSPPVRPPEAALTRQTYASREWVSFLSNNTPGTKRPKKKLIGIVFSEGDALLDYAKAVKNNPKRLFIFNDNEKESGTNGNACMRNHPDNPANSGVYTNVVGVSTGKSGVGAYDSLAPDVITRIYNDVVKCADEVSKSTYEYAHFCVEELPCSDLFMIGFQTFRPLKTDTSDAAYKKNLHLESLAACITLILCHFFDYNSVISKGPDAANPYITKQVVEHDLLVDMLRSCIPQSVVKQIYHLLHGEVIGTSRNSGYIDVTTDDLVRLEEFQKRRDGFKDTEEFNNKAGVMGYFHLFSPVNTLLNQFLFRGCYWKTINHCYQAQRFARNTDAFKLLFDSDGSETSSAIAASHESHAFKGWKNSSVLPGGKQCWLEYRDVVLFRILYEHAFYNKAVRKHLSSVKGKYIVFVNQADSHMGVREDKTGGDNVLGQLLMNLADWFRDDQKEIEGITKGNTKVTMIPSVTLM
jgi:predicted NAD-dependent protein-ADP-ribosyltransferase YbiA (DUF1768 family)